MPARSVPKRFLQSARVKDVGDSLSKSVLRICPSQTQMCYESIPNLSVKLPYLLEERKPECRISCH